MNTFIDTHCHLYSEEFNTDIDIVIKTAETEQIKQFFLPGIDSTAIEKMIGLEKKFPGKCMAMMGLHPCYVKENYKEELTIVEDWLSKRKFAAVGEIGLDFYWDKTFVSEQYVAFRKQIELSLEYQLPIVIHTRNAMAETIQVVNEYKSEKVRGIFHCFSGTYEDAVKIIELGFYLGIGGVITYKNAGLAEILEKIDLEHLVLETDAPYLTPVPFRGKRNESSYIKYIAEKLALVKNVSVDEVAATTTANAKKIFGV
ncbi:TatD family hydrolase [Ferruginibacter lapsinanis]|uniref:TatD family hydrolase n=1 Tax=Ferruginibacter lapsinanis TaxID=563172 RepID=UPI001E55FE6F|nr:TatD family hydrolase [Ferruginibacter lapsinanis]UEG51208.1 TatD family hydrolase [Ferruginibacter lapsinanis]